MTRRSIGRFKPEPPPRELIEKILEAGTWAPTHHLTEPWRFFVLTGRARERLGEVMAQALAEELPDPNSQESKAKIDAERQRPLGAPVIIAVAASPKQGSKYSRVRRDRCYFRSHSEYAAGSTRSRIGRNVENGESSLSKEGQGVLRPN